MGWYCTDCGMSSQTGQLHQHEYQHDILVAHQTEQFECQWTTFLASKEGRFAKFIADREGTK